MGVEKNEQPNFNEKKDELIQLASHFKGRLLELFRRRDILQNIELLSDNEKNNNLNQRPGNNVVLRTDQGSGERYVDIYGRRPIDQKDQPADPRPERAHFLLDYLALLDLSIAETESLIRRIEHCQSPEELKKEDAELHMISATINESITKSITRNELLTLMKALKTRTREREQRELYNNLFARGDSEALSDVIGHAYEVYSEAGEMIVHEPLAKRQDFLKALRINLSVYEAIANGTYLEEAQEDIEAAAQQIEKGQGPSVAKKIMQAVAKHIPENIAQHFSRNSSALTNTSYQLLKLFHAVDPNRPISSEFIERLKGAAQKELFALQHSVDGQVIQRLQDACEDLYFEGELASSTDTEEPLTPAQRAQFIEAYRPFMLEVFDLQQTAVEVRNRSLYEVVSLTHGTENSMIDTKEENGMLQTVDEELLDGQIKETFGEKGNWVYQKIDNATENLGPEGKSAWRMLQQIAPFNCLGLQDIPLKDFDALRQRFESQLSTKEKDRKRFSWYNSKTKEIDRFSWNEIEDDEEKRSEYFRRFAFTADSIHVQSYWERLSDQKVPEPLAFWDRVEQADSEYIEFARRMTVNPDAISKNERETMRNRILYNEIRRHRSLLETLPDDPQIFQALNANKVLSHFQLGGFSPMATKAVEDAYIAANEKLIRLNLKPWMIPSSSTAPEKATQQNMSPDLSRVQQIQECRNIIEAVKATPNSGDWEQLQYRISADSQTVRIYRHESEIERNITRIDPKKDAWQIEGLSPQGDFSLQQAILLANFINRIQEIVNQHPYYQRPQKHDPFQMDGETKSERIDLNPSGLQINGDTEILANPQWIQHYEKMGLPLSKITAALNEAVLFQSEPPENFRKEEPRPFQSPGTLRRNYEQIIENLKNAPKERPWSQLTYRVIDDNTISIIRGDSGLERTISRNPEPPHRWQVEDVSQSNLSLQQAVLLADFIGHTQEIMSNEDLPNRGHGFSARKSQQSHDVLFRIGLGEHQIKIILKGEQGWVKYYQQAGLSPELLSQTLNETIAFGQHESRAPKNFTPQEPDYNLVATDLQASYRSVIETIKDAPVGRSLDRLLYHIIDDNTVRIYREEEGGTEHEITRNPDNPTQWSIEDISGEFSFQEAVMMANFVNFVQEVVHENQDEAGEYVTPSFHRDGKSNLGIDWDFPLCDIEILNAKGGWADYYSQVGLTSEVLVKALNEGVTSGSGSAPPEEFNEERPDQSLSPEALHSEYKTIIENIKNAPIGDAWKKLDYKIQPDNRHIIISRTDTGHGRTLVLLKDNEHWRIAGFGEELSLQQAVMLANLANWTQDEFIGYHEGKGDPVIMPAFISRDEHVLYWRFEEDILSPAWMEYYNQAGLSAEQITRALNSMMRLH